MRSIPRWMAVTGIAVALTSESALAAPPTIEFDGAATRIGFTSPGIYDFSAETTSSKGGIARTLLIAQDLKGKITGLIVDKGSNIELVTEIKGTCKRSGGITVMKTTETGYGDIGNGDRLKSKTIEIAEVYGSGADATYSSTSKMTTCLKLKKPNSEKYLTTCSRSTVGHLVGIPHKGDWEVRLELSQPVVGEILGTGTITTSIESSHNTRTTAVVVEGQWDIRESTANLKLSPLFPDGDGPVTILADVIAGEGVQYPGVLNVRSVKGKLMGQRFNEAFD